MTDYSTTPRLLRTKSGTGNDTVYADGATVPDADDGLVDFSAIVPLGKGANTQIEIWVAATNASDTIQARAGTFTLRMTQVIDRSIANAPGETRGSVAVDSQTLTSQAFQSLIRVPLNGGQVFIGLESIAGAPAGATQFEIWGRAVAE